MNSSFASTEQTDNELKILNWYKLANEAALKSALVKNRKAKQQPRYNPMAESVKERTRWLQRVIAEEQSRPLEVPDHVYEKLLKDEQSEKERLEQQMWRRQEKLAKIQDQIKVKEMRRVQYNEKLAQTEKERLEAQAVAKSLGIPVDDGVFSSAPFFCDIGYEAKMARHDQFNQIAAQSHAKKVENLSVLEESIKDVYRTRSSHGPRTLSVNVLGPDAQGESDTREHNAFVSFVKKRTEGKTSTPSKVLYSVRLAPSATPVMAQDALSLDAGRRNVQTSNGWSTKGGGATSTDMSLPVRSSSAPAGTSRGSMLSARNGFDSERAQMSRAEKKELEEEKRMVEMEKQERTNGIIKEWLQDRLRKKLEREKRVKDKIRSDRNFLRTLQLTRERDREKEAEPTSKTPTNNDVPPTPSQSKSPKHWGARSPSPESPTSESLPRPSLLPPRSSSRQRSRGGDLYELDEAAIDRRLDLLAQQQQRIESWKPRFGDYNLGGSAGAALSRSRSRPGSRENLLSSSASLSR